MSNFESLIFYIFSFLLSSTMYFLYIKNNKNKLYLAISFIIPMLLGGLRYRVGTDYNNYINIYNILDNNIEIGFYYLFEILKKLGNYKLMFFVVNFLVVLTLYIALEGIDNKISPLVHYIYIFTMYVTSFNAIRQMLAVNIVFIAYNYLAEKENLKFFVLVIVSSLFHSSSIFVIPIVYTMLIKNKTLKTSFLIIFVFVFINYQYILLYFSGIDIIDRYIKLYVLADINYSFNNYTFYLDILLLCFILLFRKQLINRNKNNNLILYFSLIEISIMAIGFINPYVKRMSYYFKFSQIILLAQIPYSCKIKSNKLICKLILYAYPIMFFIIDNYVFMHSNTIPYMFIWQ